MLSISHKLTYKRLRQAIMGYPGMGCGEQGIGLGEPGFVDFIGEEGVVPAPWDCVDLSTRICLDNHQLGAVMGGKLKSGEEG